MSLMPTKITKFSHLNDKQRFFPRTDDTKKIEET